MKAFLNRNKPLLWLPLGMVPFVVLIFYILGGGQATENTEQTTSAETSGEGANYRLPEADRSIDIVDKMDSYNQEPGQVTTKDYNILGDEEGLLSHGQELALDTNNYSAPDTGSIQENRLNADISNNLLAHIQQQEKQARKDLEGVPVSQQSKIENKSSVIKPGQTVETDPNGEKASATERNQLSDNPAGDFTLTGIEELDRVFEENILLERKNDSLLQSLSQVKIQLAEWEATSEKEVMLLEKASDHGFDNPETPNYLIRAEIYETATVLSGNRVKLRLLEDCTISGQKVPMGSFVYGICTLGGERLKIEVSQLPVQGGFLPVELSVLDLDGLSGLYIPDQASRKVTKNVTGSVRSTTLLGSSTEPLTAVGIQTAGQAAQSLMQVVRQKKVTLLKNTLVYLTNQNQ